MYICSIKLLTEEPETVCSECLSKQFRCSLRIICNSRGIAGTDFSSGQTVDKTFGIIPCTAQMTQNESPGTAGTTQRRNPGSSPAVLGPPQRVGGRGSFVPMSSNTLRWVTHLRPLILFYLFVISDCAA